MLCHSCTSPSQASRLESFSELNARIGIELEFVQRIVLNERTQRIYVMAPSAHPSQQAEWKMQNKVCLLRILRIETPFDGALWSGSLDIQPYKRPSVWEASTDPLCCRYVRFWWQPALSWLNTSTTVAHEPDCYWCMYCSFNIISIFL